MILSPATLKPTGAWVDEQAQAFVEQARSQGLQVAKICRDRDSVFSKTLDAAEKSKRVAVVADRLGRIESS